MAILEPQKRKIDIWLADDRGEFTLGFLEPEVLPKDEFAMHFADGAVFVFQLGVFLIGAQKL